MFEDTDAPYSDSNTATLTEQPEQSAHDQPDHEQQNHGLEDRGREDRGEQPAQLSETQPSQAPSAQVQTADEKPAPAEDFASVLDSFTAEAAEAVSEHHVLKGTVLKLTSTHVVVDIGAKSEGMLPLAEVLDHEGNPRFKPGDEIDVMRDKGDAEEGYINLSFLKAQKLRAWDDIEKAYSENQPIHATVVERTKGGVTVDINGARAFLPGSQIDLRPVHNLDGMKGQSFDVAIVKLNKKRGNIVVSRKQLLEAEQNEKRSKTLEHLQEGTILTGVVKNLTDYGAFVDLGGIDGLLHITDMSWGRLTHPKDLVNVGDQIQVKVLKYDPDKQRVSLGFKQLTPDPWLDAEHRYPVGAHVHGRVISVTDYGAFVELEQGIEGLVHVSEMTWSKRMKHPSKLVNVGDQVDCVVLNVNPGERRISLGMRQLAANPWDSLIDKFPVGATVEGRVRNLTDFGAFVEIEEGIDGLVHVSNLSWTKRVKHPSEVLKKGDRVKAVILAIDTEKRRLSLGQSAAGGDFRGFCGNRRGNRGAVPQLGSGGWKRAATSFGTRPGARFQDYQDEPGRKESRPQHPGRRRGSVTY